MKDIINNYPVGEKEYAILEDKFGDLLHYAGWQLLKKNTQNNHTEEEEDIAQELRLSVIRAASYYKRQVYIESCFLSLEKYIIKDKFTVSVFSNLVELWKNRTKHGASRQKFGPPQEEMLAKLVKGYVPKAERPNPEAPLKFDSRFNTYCKSIAWNQLKSIGRKVTKEKSLRSHAVSISEYSYLGS